MSTPALSLSIHAQVGKTFVPFLRRHIRRAHPMIDRQLRELSLSLVNDATMSALHKRFMNLTGATDVLTFPLEFDRAGHCIGGEIALCVPEARRHSRICKTLPQNELLLYAIHGMLHLAGLDDRTTAGFKAMHHKEDQVLSRLGVGAVFAPAPASANPRSPRGG